MSSSNDPGPPLILLGAGGHAKVLLALVQAAQRHVIGVCDPQLVAEDKEYWRGVRVLGRDEAIEHYNPHEVGLINGIGKLVGSSRRTHLYTSLRQRGYRFPTLVHPSAWVAADARLSEGVQIMAGVCIQPGCRVGENSIVNTHASIDHDCDIAEHVHIAPGATLCGNVRVDSRAFIGAGAVILQNLTVGADAVVGAGTTLSRDLAPGHTRIGTASRFKINQ